MKSGRATAKIWVVKVVPRVVNDAATTAISKRHPDAMSKPRHCAYIGLIDSWVVHRYPGRDASQVSRAECGPEEEEEEVAVVAMSDTVSNPWAVMVHHGHAAPTYTAVVRAWGFGDAALLAHFQISHEEPTPSAVRVHKLQGSACTISLSLSLCVCCVRKQIWM